MKTKINHILPVLLLTAASGLTTVSCNDFLDKTPDNRTELRNIRTHPIPFGEVITVQFQPPTWHSRR